MSNIDVALRLALMAHEGQTDADGEAAILHPLAVGLRGDTDEERATGFLCRILHDERFSADRLLDEGVADGTVYALEALLESEAETPVESMRRVVMTDNPVAIQVRYNELMVLSARRGDDASLAEALRIGGKAVADMKTVRLHTPSAEYATAIFAAGCF